MRQAIEEDRFLLYCQPILDLKTDEISQYELLLRLPGGEGCEPLLRNSFLYVAERFGIMLAIDNWVVRKEHFHCYFHTGCRSSAASYATLG
jgi:EAL domain-containing protein (putative c-di-GMP-specific phosphodiesterase class I)